ncbi:isochorismatase family protein [Allorhizobium sp. BGMRC 0089]|uniref:isochorismatase family protein n=1 Tax=Allorhizobium sonneratiae TaxID=2934936 RepID=UPI0020332A8B|nr:isochorismatase family protein [Allorhizobium sonneratiae]MCM2292557.1 isochorismatase family protein [Allorhizobium sonneratiae]
MTVTALDPKTALIVIDLQKGLVSLPGGATPMEEIVRHACILAAVFRKHGLPVVLVNVAGGPPGRTEQPRAPQNLPDDWTDLIVELDRRQEDHVVTKHTPGAFTRTGLEVHLRSLEVTQVVIVGIATSNGVEVTARQAYELGFNVTLVTDAMTDRQADAHVWSITRVFPRIGETGTTQEIIDLLTGRV